MSITRADEAPGTEADMAGAGPQPPVELDERRQDEARRYARRRRYLLAVDLAVGAAYLVAALFTGWSGWLKAWASGVTASPYLVVALFTLPFFAAYGVLITPLHFVGGYVWPRRFGLSVQSLGGWAWDHIKGMFLGLVLVWVVLEVLYALLRFSPGWWWLWMSVFLLFFTVVLANLAPLVIVPLFYRLEPLEDAELVSRLTRLAQRAGAGVKGVYRMNLSAKTTAANAALMGLGNTRRIVLGDTLLDNYTVDEVETVLAHELGHHVHGDLGKGIAVETALTLGGLWLAHQALQGSVNALGFEGIMDIAALPLLGLILGAFGVVTMPLSNTYSRWRERLADRYALEVTHKPEAFATAMIRLANQNLAEVDPPRWVEVMLYSHPRIGKRVAMARRYRSGGAHT